MKAVKTELDIKAKKIQAVMAKRANANLVIAGSSDFAQAEAYKRAQMAVVRSVEGADEILLGLKAKIEQKRGSITELQNKYNEVMMERHPVEATRKNVLAEGQRALAKWLGEREAVSVSGVLIKTAADIRTAEQKAISAIQAVEKVSVKAVAQ